MKCIWTTLSQFKMCKPRKSHCWELVFWFYLHICVERSGHRSFIPLLLVTETLTTAANNLCVHQQETTIFQCSRLATCYTAIGKTVSACADVDRSSGCVVQVKWRYLPASTDMYLHGKVLEGHTRNYSLGLSLGSNSERLGWEGDSFFFGHLFYYLNFWPKSMCCLHNKWVS